MTGWRGFIELLNRLLELFTKANEKAVEKKRERAAREHSDLNDEVGDTSKSLKDRANALCKIEKQYNPDSDCDDGTPPGDDPDGVSDPS